jgi:hypothetical protein
MKTIKELASAIAKKEGKKSQARIGDIREILSILSDMLFDEKNDRLDDLVTILYKNGRKRAKKSKIK